jgi:CheY-like chemotaxis protein
MMQLLLEAEGVRVFTAGDGLEGAALIERVRPDLALVDLGLPAALAAGFDEHVTKPPDPDRLERLLKG